jgi:hypothetical protein
MRTAKELTLGESPLELVPVRSSIELSEHGHDAEADTDDEKESVPVVQSNHALRPFQRRSVNSSRRANRCGCEENATVFGVGTETICNGVLQAPEVAFRE